MYFIFEVYFVVVLWFVGCLFLVCVIWGERWIVIELEDGFIEFFLNGVINGVVNGVIEVNNIVEIFYVIVNFFSVLIFYWLDLLFVFGNKWLLEFKDVFFLSKGL